jgi:hypothetical protein
MAVVTEIFNGHMNPAGCPPINLMLFESSLISSKYAPIRPGMGGVQLI